MSFEQRYQKLNEEQKHAVDTTEGPVMVVAGPGSGKTEILSMRVANILRNHDVFGANILCLTFTDSAAKNMRERLARLIGAEAFKVNIHTFHSFANDIIQQNYEDFYEGQRMRPADEIIQIEIISEILETLPLSDALSKKQIDDSFVYLSSVRDKIGKLKRAGVPPGEYLEILTYNKNIYHKIEQVLVPVFEQRLSKKIFTDIEQLLVELEGILQDQNMKKIAGLDILPYEELILRSLLRAYQESQENGSTKALSQWKKDWLKKDTETKALHLKDYFYIDRNISLAHVYEQYQKKMKAAGYIDFEDMILDVLAVLQNKPGVLETLQEQFQFILVDEFQDTNEAQMRILSLLTDHPVFEGNPNIMVVGDDDQAIYKFQGAEINNILQFKKRFPSVQVITMTKNYRSTKFIVNFAQRVIEQGDDRLVHRISDLEKELEAANPNIPEGTIVTHTFDAQVHEYNFIIQEIKRLLQAGKSYSDIAVIARNHRQLEQISQHFTSAGIAIQYEKKRNILQEPIIIQIIQIIRLLVSLSKDKSYYDESLLIEVLQFPFWDLERSTVWKLILEYHNMKNQHPAKLIDVMLDSENQHIKNIAQWLLTTSSQISIDNYQVLLDKIIGPGFAEYDSAKEFVSPLRSYYFTQDLYQEDPYHYLSMLSSINRFMSVIREKFSLDGFKTLFDVLTIIDLFQKHNISVTDTSVFVSGEQSIQLLTAHKSKGLEFDTVFVVSCQKDIWLKNQGRSMIAFPKNVPLESSAENWDDYLRLFFVAMTRAKSHLYLTSYQKKDNGRDTQRVPFLSPDILSDSHLSINEEHKNIDVTDLVSELEAQLFPRQIVLDESEKMVIRPLLDSYVMSVTHLNNFLDVTQGGPQQFFERNLLRFPQAKSVHMSYGTALHATIEKIYFILKRDGVLPNHDESVQIFEQELKKEPLNQSDYKKYLEQGEHVLKIYVISKNFDPNHLIETNFSYQNVFVDDVQIRGKIDKMILNKELKTVSVYDLKTGKYKTSWKAYDDQKKIQLHNYKRQLIFYKLLVEGSRDYGQYNVSQAGLEFLYPTNEGEIITLEYDILNEDVQRLKLLIQAVMCKIKQLDFPDISKYENSYQGILDFENDLIAEIEPGTNLTHL